MRPKRRYCIYSVISYQLSVISYQLSVISYQLSVGRWVTTSCALRGVLGY
ncbi:hypothetical protein [Microcystis sp. M31BS1]|nr:hypothetical protein [Microcystis sp. M31BS1]